MRNRKVLFVIPLVLLALIAGLYTGFLRLGWNLPLSQTMAHHGFIMACSFLGTLIILERIVVVKIPWFYLFPVINGLSLPMFLLDQYKIGYILLLIGTLGLIISYIIFYVKYGEKYLLLMLVGSMFLIIGILLPLFGQLIAASVPYLFGFLLFTITGERLELGKFLPDKKFKKPLLYLGISVFTIGIFVNFHDSGHYFSGAGMILLALWMLRYDIVNKSIKSHGIHKYVGITLFSGYIWLLISGILMTLNLTSVFYYDALLHSFFLGFTFLMIFAHGPIIFPGVAGFNFRPYHKSLYFWVILLNLFLALRIISDIASIVELRKISGLINGFTIIGFFVNLLILIRYHIKKEKSLG